MRIIIDFDDTVFDTTTQIKKTHRLVTLHGVSVADWQKAWPVVYGAKYLGKGLYSIWEHAERFRKNKPFDSRKFIREYMKFHETEYYLFPDTLEFLKFARKQGKVFLVTYGQRRFQQWKVKLSKLAPLFHRVKIVSSLKAYNFSRIVSPNDLNIFLDDNATEIDEVKKTHPNVLCIKVSRPGTKHEGQPSKYKDFEVKNLLEAEKIISQIQNRFFTDINQAVKSLRTGQAVVYPTDTAYGLGVDATNRKAVERLYKIKGRKFNQPVHIIVDSLSMAKEYAEFDALAERLFKKFMPGALTLVLPLKNNHSPGQERGASEIASSGFPPLGKGGGNALQLLSAGTGTIGIRMPDNKAALQLVRKLGRPITTTSANPAAGPTPYSAIDSYRQFFEQKNQPDLYLDAGRLPKQQPSTMLLLKNGKIKLLRKGPISLKQIKFAQ